MFLKMNHASLTADMHVCQLGAPPQILPFPWLGAFFWDMIWENVIICVVSLHSMTGNGGTKTISEVWDFSFVCVCLRHCCAWRSKQSLSCPLRYIWPLKTCLVFTEWVCCCEAPWPSRWRIHSHVSTRDCCPSPSTTVPGGHLPRACFWSL